MKKLGLIFAAVLLGATSSMAADLSLSADTAAGDGDVNANGLSVGVLGAWNFGKDIWEGDGDYPLENAGFYGAYLAYDQKMDGLLLGARVSAQIGQMQEIDYPAFQYNAFYDLNARAGAQIDSLTLYGTGGYTISAITEDGSDYLRGGINVGAGIELMATEDVVLGAEYIYRYFKADCEPHGDTFEQNVSSVQLHLGWKL